VEQELLILPEHLSSLPDFSGVRVTRSLVVYVCFVCPFVSTQKDHILSQKDHILSYHKKTTYYHKKTTYYHKKTTYYHKRPHIITKRPHIITKRPHIITKRPHIITKRNDNINMDSTVATSRLIWKYIRLLQSKKTQSNSMLYSGHLIKSWLYNEL
jgi:hypothetical protein